MTRGAVTLVAVSKNVPMKVWETYGRQGKEGDSQEGKASSEEPSLPGTRGLITVANSSKSNLGRLKKKKYN